MKFYDTKRQCIENFEIGKTLLFKEDDDGDCIVVRYDEGYGLTMEKFYTIKAFHDRFKDLDEIKR